MPRDIFDAPPAEPLLAVTDWLSEAIEQGVNEPRSISLATADSQGDLTNRTIRVLDILPDKGLVFTSHRFSQKGRDIENNGRGSALFYWREIQRQIMLSGVLRPLDAETADSYWDVRPIDAKAMSIATQQSAPLTDENHLRMRARQIATTGEVPSRPDTWVTYILRPLRVEFWQGAEDHLYPRLQYLRESSGWKSCRLQP